MRLAEWAGMLGAMMRNACTLVYKTMLMCLHYCLTDIILGLTPYLVDDARGECHAHVRA